MSRCEYDGSEGWEYHTLPTTVARIATSFTTVKNGDLWATIKEMNGPRGKYGD